MTDNESPVPWYWARFIAQRPRPFYFEQWLNGGDCHAALLDECGGVVVTGRGETAEAAAYAAWLQVPEHVRNMETDVK